MTDEHYNPLTPPDSSLPPEEPVQSAKPSYERFSFFGQGATYFGIVALNVVLTLVTVGLYYPWAKAAYRKYLWNETEFNDSRFVFNGTGKEMFKGFLIAYFIFLGFYASLAMVGLWTYGWVFVILFYVLLVFLIPFAIYGSWRYRFSRTSWRGIFFSFDGNFKEFLKIFIPQLLLTIITFGVYTSWMRVKVMKYLFSHTKIGKIRMDFHGDGATYFGINFVGILLSYITLFLYSPIWMKDRFNFTVNHTSLSDGEQTRYLRSSLQGGEAWKTMMLNLVLLIFTAGLAFPWTLMRTMRMYFNNTWMPNEFDWDNLAQSDSNYKDATGDEMADIIDIDFGF